jgi:hypothetical protein
VEISFAVVTYGINQLLSPKGSKKQKHDPTENVYQSTDPIISLQDDIKRKSI